MGWQDIPGWVDDHLERVYRDAVAGAREDAVFVEIGVAFGKSAALMAEILEGSGRRDIRFHVVDNWRVESWLERDCGALLHAHGSFYDAFCAMMNRHAPTAWDLIDTIHRCDSTAASTLFEARSVDFVFVDGDHSRTGVLADLGAWVPKVRPGGLIAGHDHTPSHPGVEEACLAYFGPGRYEVTGSCWRRRATLEG